MIGFFLRPVQSTFQMASLDFKDPVGALEAIHLWHFAIDQLPVAIGDDLPAEVGSNCCFKLVQPWLQPWLQPCSGQWIQKDLQCRKETILDGENTPD